VWSSDGGIDVELQRLKQIIEADAASSPRATACDT
jgi:hypothetical protein